MVPVSLTLTPLFADSFLAVFSKKKRGELSRPPICRSLHQHPVPVKSSKSKDSEKKSPFLAQRFSSNCRPWRKSLPLYRHRGQMSLVLPGEWITGGAKTQPRQAALVLSLPGWRHLLLASLVTAPTGAFFIYLHMHKHPEALRVC
ncbi:hypothetical protein QQF64_032441 [Cirrhinus molitorella]|uniref:Uncharacterized protein n=1 Tax=Cirrhinus molitorella TaxID=172907 RepID=A0ABR3MZS9_9TELE